jgi:hypothetical protein
MPQAIPIAPQLLRPSEQCCSPGGSFDGVQLEKRSWLSHKDALNQVIGFGRSSWAADRAQPVIDRGEKHGEGRAD